MKLLITIWVLAILSACGAFYYINYSLDQRVQQNKAQRASEAQTSNTTNVDAIKVETPAITIQATHDAVNTERLAHKLGELVLNEKLNSSAQAKCLDMQFKNYWAHNAPDGTEPWNFFKQAGILNYRKLGENLAYGFYTGRDVSTGWMNSPTHRDNMLDPVFTDVGYGVCDFRGTDLVVQHLMKP